MLSRATFTIVTSRSTKKYPRQDRPRTNAERDLVRRIRERPAAIAVRADAIASRLPTAALSTRFTRSLR